MDEDYRSLLIVNNTSDCNITFYVYWKHDPICWLSCESKIIKPKDKYYYSTKTGFQFRLVARSNDGQTKDTVLELQTWTEHKFIKVKDSLDVIEDKLANFPHDKQICVRQMNRDKELSAAGGGRNLYEILKLDIDKVRKMSPVQQEKVIKRAFHREIRRWHPDHNFGDDEIAREIIMAYDVLGNPEARERYNNLADCDSGWLSRKCYKAMFWPDCNTEEQKRAYKQRMWLLAASCGLTITGVITTALTAGAAAPFWVITGAIVGGGFAGAGVQSLPQAMNREAIVDGCDIKKWAGKAGIGFMGGAVTGGAAVGIAAGITGIGSAAMESAAVSMGQYIGVGAGTGATGGVVSSLASDAATKFVDGQDVTWKQVVGHAACGGIVGAVAGAVGGAVTKAVVDGHTSAAVANLEGEVGEQVTILIGAKRLKFILSRNLSRALTENSTEAVMGSAAQFAEERLDDSMENRSPNEHLVEGAQKLAATAVKEFAKNSASAVVSHVINEGKVRKSMKEDCLKKSSSDTHDEGGDGEHARGKVTYIFHEEDNEHRTNWKRSKCSVTYQIKKKDDVEPTTGIPTVQRTYLDTLAEIGEKKDLPPDGHIKYISDGGGLLKMVVTYHFKSHERREEVTCSKNSIVVPARARNIKVRFQGWGDVLKYDRFQKRWCKPYEAHVFKFDVPPVRTFTISGSLHWKAVMKVTDEYHDETLEM